MSADRSRSPAWTKVFTRWPDLRINIEPKSDQAVDPLVELIRSTGSLDRVCVWLFNDARVRKMRAALGSRLYVDRRGTDRAAPLRQLGVPFLDGFIKRSGAACAQTPIKQWVIPVTDRRFVDRCHGLGMQVHAWTIDEPAEIATLLDLGVDGIMTNKPTVLKQELVARGSGRERDPRLTTDGAHHGRDAPGARAERPAPYPSGTREPREDRGRPVLPRQPATRHRRVRARRVSLVDLADLRAGWRAERRCDGGDRAGFAEPL